VLSLEDIIQLIMKNLPEYDRKAVNSMIEEKRQELGPDVVNDESAAMIVARELGIDTHQVSKSRLRIEDITENTRNPALTAKIVEIGTVRTFQKKDGGEGRVASITVGDETGKIRVAMWDEMTKVISDEEVSVGDVIQIRGAYVKKGLRDALELNLGRMGGIRVLDDYDLQDLEIDLGSPTESKVKDLKEGLFDLTMTVQVQRVFDLRTFTRKRDGSEGKVQSVVAADETGSTRLVFWDEQTEKVQDLEEGEVIKITGALTRAGRNEGEIEVHASRSTTVERGLKVKMKAVSTQVTSTPTVPLGQKSIAELEVGMRDVDIEAKVYRVFPPKEFERDGNQGQVQNIILVDESGKTLRTAFWHEDVEKIADLKEGDVIRIEHGYVKKGFRDDIEFGVGKQAEITINPKGSKVAKLELTQLELKPAGSGKRTMIADIDDSTVNSTVEVCGIIVGIGQTNPVYPSCPECRKKVTLDDDGNYTCADHDRIKEPEYRMLYKITIDDGSGSIRATLFGAAGEELLQMTAAEAQQMIEKTKNQQAPIEKHSDRILGTYVVVKGRVNKYKDTIDIGASELSFADPVEEVKRMKGTIEEFLN
jgi:replication factor A1